MKKKKEKINYNTLVKIYIIGLLLEALWFTFVYFKNKIYAGERFSFLYGMYKDFGLSTFSTISYIFGILSFVLLIMSVAIIVMTIKQRKEKYILIAPLYNILFQIGYFVVFPLIVMYGYPSSYERVVRFERIMNSTSEFEIIFFIIQILIVFFLISRIEDKKK